jgi:hypothetical protein
MADTKQEGETYSEEEIERRREAAPKVLLATPRKPHKPTGLTPAKAKKPKLAKASPLPKRSV